MPRSTQIAGFVSLVVATLGLLALAWFIHPLTQKAVVLLIMLAGAESLVAFGGVSWAFRRSNKAFYSLYFGGTLFRLMSIGAAAWVLQVMHLPLAVPLVSLVVTYFVLSVVQIPFFCRAAS